MLSARPEADRVEVPLDGLPALVTRHSQRGERRLDVLGGGQGRDQVELLEDEAQRPQPQLGQGGVAEPLEGPAVEADRAAARPIERPEELQERRLAGAGRAEDGDELAAPDGEGEGVEGQHPGRVLTEEPGRGLELVGRRDVANSVHGLPSLGHSALLSASAGRRRAARRPPAAPASRPPTIARPIASASRRASTGAPRTISVLPAVTLPCPNGPRPPRDWSSTAASSVGPIASMIAAPAIPSAAPRSPPSAPCTSDSAVTWRTTRRWRQPRAFNVPSSRIRFCTLDSVSKVAIMNAASRATIASAVPSFPERFSAPSSSRAITSSSPATASADWARTCTPLIRPSRSDSACSRPSST